MDYIKLNYLSYSYKVLNPDAILYLHTSLNHLSQYLSHYNTPLTKFSFKTFSLDVITTTKTPLLPYTLLPMASGWRPVFAHRTSRLPNLGSFGPAKYYNFDRSGKAFSVKIPYYNIKYCFQEARTLLHFPYQCIDTFILIFLNSLLCITAGINTKCFCIIFKINSENEFIWFKTIPRRKDIMDSKVFNSGPLQV